MFVVTVEFEVKVDKIDEFREAMLQQARNSLRNEPDCKQFDVCWNDDAPELIFLYEKYTSPDAFQRHRQFEHFKHFNDTVQPWTVTKQVKTYNDCH